MDYKVYTLPSDLSIWYTTHFSGAFTLTKSGSGDENKDLFFIPSGPCYNQGWSFMNKTILSILESFPSTSGQNTVTRGSPDLSLSLDQLYLEHCNISLMENNKSGNNLTTLPSITRLGWNLLSPELLCILSKSKLCNEFSKAFDWRVVCSV